MVSDQHLAIRPDSQLILQHQSQRDFSVSTSLTICFNKFAVDGHVADRDRVQFWLFRQPLFTRGDFNWFLVRSTFSLTWDVVPGSCSWQNVDCVGPISETQNK